ncbi:Bax inhibitor-1/YccA family protein [Crocinitomix catalasitica]|uniref:Bax inhibitor-1/YccA family protein n=1 Tax=Crocinitomix catalasitica TaxID=184607 RepID=UPI000489999F|nr:Bax inhibitor-1/YccA family protein [Crocinitomix catalasitica]
MEYNNYEILDTEVNTFELSKTFFANVYKYMFMALAITGVVAYYSASTGWYLDIAFTEAGMSPVGYIIAFAPLAVVIFIQARFQKMSFGNIFGLFILYSVILGISLSFIFLIYTGASIAITFFVTAGAFGSMALMGYYTKTDLSKMGSLLYMLFFGMIIASVANFFMGSDTLDYVISFLGLFVFTGLTAWEMQRMKQVASNTELKGDERKKHELMGGLTLYILFINLFLSILRFTGER